CVLYGNGVRENRHSYFFRFIDDDCQRVLLRTTRCYGENRFDYVDAGLFQLSHGTTSLLVWYRTSGNGWTVRRPRLIRARRIHAQWPWRASARRARQLNESGCEEPRTFDRARIQTPLQLDDLFGRIAARLNRGEAAVEEFLHPRHGFFLHPLRWITRRKAAADDMPMIIDEPRHHGHAANVDLPRSRLA